MHNSGGPVGAETSLARTHSQAQVTPDIIDNVILMLRQHRFNLGTSDNFALADELLAPEFALFQPLQALPQGIEFLVIIRRLWLGDGGPARPLCLQFLADQVNRAFGHLAM